MAGRAQLQEAEFELVRRLSVLLDREERLSMRVNAFNDIHGNLSAMEAVLQDVRQANVDQVDVGDDVVPDPMSRETHPRLQEF